MKRKSGTFRVIPGPTPHGGKYAIVFYQGKSPGSRATHDNAEGMEIIEYDDHGKVILRTYMRKPQDAIIEGGMGN